VQITGVKQGAPDRIGPGFYNGNGIARDLAGSLFREELGLNKPHRYHRYKQDNDDGGNGNNNNLLFVFHAGSPIR
jgi:hypothetical protein